MQAARDLTLLGPPNEEQERKRRRISAMLASKLARTVQSIQRQECMGLAGDSGSSSGMDQSGPGAVASSSMASARQAAAGPAAPATPAVSIYRQRPRKRSWADLADELPVVVRMPVWPESLEAAAEAARSDPAAAVAQILRQATPEGATPVSSLRQARSNCCGAAAAAAIAGDSAISAVNVPAYQVVPAHPPI